MNNGCRKYSFYLYTLLLGTLVLTSSCQPDLPADVALAYEQLADEIDYNIHVKPILSDKCFACHGPDNAKQKAGLRLDIASAAYGELPETPGKVAIKPGRLGASEFFHRIISDDPDYRMPTPDSHLSLSTQEKAILIKWIENGAEYKPHWAFTGIKKPELPRLNDDSWVINPTDRFVLARLEKEHLKPSKQADKEILLRRLYLDLTGLPPSISEIDAFLADNAPDAYEKQVDKLLASPHFGEKMASDWLDLARFADSHGYTVDRLRDMSPYRDWVIKAFNKNLPYDRFLQEQLAGDLMPQPSKEMQIATAFNRNHQQNMEGGIIEEEFQTEYVVDRVNTFGDAMLGISLSCAKCHDHKYDPISQKNYFELYSFFNNIREAGQISWDDAMPSPTLLLPTKTQEAHLKRLNDEISEREQQLKKEISNQSEPFQKWVSSGQYKNLSTEKIPEYGLQAYYSFDKKSLRNTRSKNYNGTLSYNGAPVKTSPVFISDDAGTTGLKMDGDTYLGLGSAGTFRKSDPFSIGIRILIPGDLSEGVIFHKSDAERLYNFRGYHLYLKDNKLEISLAYAAPSNAIIKVTKAEIPKGKWIHLTMTYDGSGDAKGLQLYLDGKAASLVTEINQLTKDILFDRKIEPGLQVGAWGRGLGFKNGLVSDLAVYTRDLTPFEIQVLAGQSSWTTLANTAADQLSGAQLAILKDYYISAVSKPIQTIRNELIHWRTVLADSTKAVKELMVMQEYPTPKQAYVLLRGEYGNKGKKVFPGTPEAILSFPDDLPKNRLGLSLWLTSEQNPLTARVAVNRYWQNLFGVGLVKTSEDFGNQGEMPTHPELLDWLASEFRDSGWDVKRLHKLLVMSATYRQDSKLTDSLREKDPENRLLARGPSKRLTAEMIRDNALSASGLLNKNIGGPSVKPYQPDGLWEINSARYQRDSGDNVYRRSLYVLVKRSVPNPTLASFDATDRSYCVIRRQQTNTPLQALVTLNDPTFIEASRKLGEQMATQEEDKTAIEWAYRQTTGRKPTDKELLLFQQQYKSEYAKIAKAPKKAFGWLHSGQYRINGNQDPTRVAAFSIVASTILNSDATLTKR